MFLHDGIRLQRRLPGAHSLVDGRHRHGRTDVSPLTRMGEHVRPHIGKSRIQGIHRPSSGRRNPCGHRPGTRLRPVGGLFLRRQLVDIYPVHPGADRKADTAVRRQGGDDTASALRFRPPAGRHIERAGISGTLRFQPLRPPRPHGRLYRRHQTPQFLDRKRLPRQRGQRSDGFMVCIHVDRSVSQCGTGFLLPVASGVRARQPDHGERQEDSGHGPSTHT